MIDNAAPDYMRAEIARADNAERRVLAAQDTLHGDIWDALTTGDPRRALWTPLHGKISAVEVVLDRLNAIDTGDGSFVQLLRLVAELIDYPDGSELSTRARMWFEAVCSHHAKFHRDDLALMEEEAMSGEFDGDDLP